MHIEEHSPSSVIVTNSSPFTGESNSLIIPMSYESFMAAFNKWQGGEHIQNAFSLLNADLREFLMTGITPDEWNETFGGSEDCQDAYNVEENDPPPSDCLRN
jgi:hypothetical protein